jgi:pilus assembly protein CpaC
MIPVRHLPWTVRCLRRMVFVLALLPAAAAWAEDPRLEIEMGKSLVLETPESASAIAVTDPSIADVVPLATANKLQVQGKKVGTTDLVVQQRGGTILRWPITVTRDLTELLRRVDSLVAGPVPNIYALSDRIVVEGTVDDLDTLERVAQVVALYDDKFVNLLTVGGDHQVQLEVVFAEISRTSLRELGLNVLWGRSDLGFGMVGPATSPAGQVTQEGLSAMNGGTVTSIIGGAFQLLAYSGELDLAAVMSVLDENNLSRVLARPTLVALSGQQAEFLAGGEIPIPAPTGNGAISVQYKEYGVKLVFVPTVLSGETVDLRVYVEVSQPDYTNGTRLTGIELPGFVSRKGKSHLRIGSGMTFAMAGLLDETTTHTRAQVPLLGDIPVIGALFRYIRHQRQETELMIFVTPRLVRPLAPGEVPPAPGTAVDHHPTDLQLFLLGLDHRVRPATAAPPGNIGLERGGS